MIVACLLLGTTDIVVHRPEIPAATAAWRASLPEGRPALRGFRAPAPSDQDQRPPIDLPPEENLRKAALIVSKNLARDGILATAAKATAILGGAEPDRLRAVGLPIDWLEFFHGGRFEFRPTLPGFAAATESGEDPVALVRLQIASPDYWSGPGDGGSLDVVRQLLDALPESEFVASVEEKHLEKVLAAARGWNLGREGRFVLVPEPLPVSQWAQDDGKPGLAPASRGSGKEIVTLAPRYASRGEDGALLVPGETFLLDGFAATGHRVVRSPLLFQGGDLLVARDPKSGERLLFLGEANVWRNTALGLSKDQVVEAFRIEFGVDRCTVLPAVSFHVDQELCFRAVGDKLVVFVADPVEAVRIVLRCGIEVLGSTGVLSSSQAAKARADLDEGKDQEFLASVVPAASTRCTGFGRFPESFARNFSRGPSDSGVGNLQRFLLALDLLMSWTLPVDELPLDPHSIAYLRSFQRQDAERREMVVNLRKSGCEIVKIPSLPEANRGIDYLNGIQLRGKCLVPVWGGLYAPLDEAALAAFRKRLGPEIAVIPVLTSESQRRGGALHCSASACPQP